MRQWKSRQQHLDGFESGGADLTVPPPAVSISSPRKKAFLPEARTREKEFPAIYPPFYWVMTDPTSEHIGVAGRKALS